MEFFSAGTRKVTHDILLLHLDSVELKGSVVAKLLPAWGTSVSDNQYKLMLDSINELMCWLVTGL